MPKPLTRAQQRENAAFLKHLRRTGNACEAAKLLGCTRGKFTWRRARHPAFAVEWDAALVLAHAACGESLGVAPRQPPPDGDPYIRRSNTGRLQLRRAQQGLIDHAVRQRFLAALSASANVRLSAAAAGVKAVSLYHHRRHNPAFAREWKLALQMGYDRLELALLEAGYEEAFREDDWRRNDPPAIPPMTANQALQLMYLHQKEARLLETPIPVDRLRPGETWEARSEMMRMISEARRVREREAFRIAEAERLATKGYTLHRLGGGG